ncbi:MAG: MBL fold metallo-hydrolase, partial [bacterium]|nr:MBL fold metallo-hydrolase [bacterium]
MNETNLTFYGVRGSYPAPHKNIGKFGGNTSSILFENNDNLIILDAGTGIINLGIFLKNERPHIKKLDIFITHFHMDHIQGLPFFEPL